MSKLELILLGRFECLLSSDNRITLSMRKAEVLLAYLALTPGLRHPRERLINLLWSDRSDEQARNSLRQCLSAIKKSLGEIADLVLLVDRTTVCLVPELIEVDVLEFERLATLGDYESLSTAADLYQGEFLEGISIRDAVSQEWLENERNRFKRQFIEILLNLAETQLVSHDFGNAIKSAERLVKQDPLGEAGWRILMRSYAEHGDRNHALVAYKRCREILQKELGVEPEAATIELQESIKAGQTTSAREDSENKDAAQATPESSGLNTARVSRENNILVLPLQNLSADPDQQYFSDGLTESIIMGLSLFPYLNVHSRNSSFAARDKNLSIQEIGITFGAQYVIEGSVRRSENRIRVSAQLIDTQSGEQIWNNRIENKLEETFALEDQITRSIVAAIKGKIDVTDEKISIQKQARDIQSYDLLLQGYHHLVKFNPKGNLIGIELLQQCLEIDYDNPQAHLHLYQGYIINWISGWSDPRSKTFEQAGIHIKKAFELAPDQAMIQASFAEYNMFCREWELAETHAERAFHMNPNDPEILATISAIQASLGNVDKALELADACHLIDPFHPWVDWVAGVAYYSGRKYSEALKTFKNMPNPADEIEGWIAACYHRLGDPKNATMHLERYLEITKQNMARVPSSLDEWETCWRSSTSYRNEAELDSPFEALCEAGLEAFVEQSSQAISPDSAHNIAVLPFDNLSGDPEQEYFSDGITDSIILNLSLFPGLNVKSRNSSFAFKQQIKSLGEISKELEVDYIVEGSIRKSDQRIRITVQLIEAASGNQVWGKRYDAEIEDLFDLEEELSRTIATTVTGQIESDLQRIAIAKGAAHQQSYDLLLQGVFHCKKGTAADMVIAIEKLHQCLELDSSNALAHATLYACHEMNWIDRWVSDFEASRKLCKEHASKALALNPELGPVKVAFAEYLIFNRDYDEAETHLNRALDINPNDSEAIAAVALNLSCQGKFEAALEQARLALKLDPYHTWARWILSESKFFCGLYSEALDTIADTGNPPGFIQIYKIAANIRLGRKEIARDTLKNFLQHCGESMSSMPRTIDEWRAYSRDNAPFADPAMNDQIIDCMLQAGLEEEMAAVQESADPEALPSILVLPFGNLSGDPEQEYFSDGISESVIQNLSSFSGLNVKSRHTSFAFKDSPLSIDEIAKELDVQYIIDGSVRKRGEQIRIAVQLGDTASGNQIWGKRFDTPLDDLFAIEEELVLTIAGTISGKIEHEIKTTSIKKPARNLKSYDYLARGWYHGERFAPEDSFAAIEQGKKCLEIDPDNADAHTLIAAVSNVLLYENWTDDRTKSRQLSRQHISRAVELEPDHALSHAFMAERYLFEKDFKKSMFHANKSIELSPALPDGYSYKSYLLAVSGEIDEAVRMADLSMRLDPYHYYMGWNAGQVLRMAGQYERAIDAFRSVPILPASLMAEIAACQAGLGHFDEASATMVEYHQIARKQMPNYPRNVDEWRALWDENVPCEREQDFNVFFDLLQQAGLCDDLAEPGDDIPSIAVLPFENMSGDSEQEYFSDGITNDIVTMLSHIRRLRVVARHSTMAYKDHKPPISEIAEEQGVRFILDGSVRKSGKRIRVNVQLIDSHSGENCWAENYDRKLKDIFAVQDEITRNIAVELQVHLISGESARETSMGTKHIKAWELCSMAWDLQDSYVKDNMLKARRMVDEALQLDPDYSAAWVVLGWTHWQGANVGFSDSIDDSIREAMIAADKALAIDPNFSEALVLKGCCHVSRDEPDLAVEACSKAVEISPGNAEVQALTAYTYNYIGAYDKALPHHEASLRLCPVCPNWFLLVGGTIYQHTGDLEKAIETYRKGVEVEPESPICRYYLIDALMEAGRENEAQACADELRVLNSSFTITGMLLSHSHDKEIRERYQSNLEKVGFKM